MTEQTPSHEEVQAAIRDLNDGIHIGNFQRFYDLSRNPIRMEPFEYRYQRLLDGSWFGINSRPPSVLGPGSPGAALLESASTPRIQE